MTVHLKFFEIPFFFFFQSKLVSTTNDSCMLGTTWVYDKPSFFFFNHEINTYDILLLYSKWLFHLCIRIPMNYFWVLIAVFNFQLIQFNSIQFSIKIILTLVGRDPVNIKGFVSGPLWVIHPSSATAPSGSGDTTVKEVRPYIFVL